MTAITTSAPGKAVLCGEYVVLGGAVAGSMAINRRAVVTLRPHTLEYSTVNSPGYLDGEFRFRSSRDGSIAWIDPPPSPDAFRLLEVAWRRGRSGVDDVALTLDTRAFHDPASRSKLGLGSSAALATALVAALNRQTAQEQASVFSLAREVHGEFQRGGGSGVDVATSAHGGVIAYRPDNDVTELRWPEGLAYRLYWSGVSADTVTQLASYRQSARPDADRRLVVATDAVLAAMRDGSRAPLISAFDAYVDVLSDFDQANELGIFSAGHDKLAELARGMEGCVYKPCGAGGGDIGMAIANGERALDEFTLAAEEYGFAPLDAVLDVVGLRVGTG